jgi:hypothetical protein
MNEIIVYGSRPKTSTSSSSMTPKTVLRLSMNPLTATRSMRFVVALYSVRRTVFSADDDDDDEAVGELGDGIVEKERRTRGESSWSTRRDWRAAEARRAVGRGTSIVLGMSAV